MTGGGPAPATPQAGQGQGGIGHVPELDGLRGIATLMVLVWHFVGAGLRSAPDPLAQSVGQALMFGRTGVDLFFVLSGFLITGILIHDRGRNGAILAFMIRRFFRIWPAYLLLIACALSLAWLLPSAIRAADSGRMFNHQIPLWSYFVFLQNVFMSTRDSWGAGALSVTWSVAIEEHFYLVFPFIVALVPVRLLAWPVAIIGIASALARAWVHLKWPSLGYAPYVLTPLRLDGLCAGAMLAIIVNAYGLDRLRRFRRVIALAVVVLSLPTLGVVWSYGSGSFAFHQYVWGHAALSLFYAAVLALLLCHVGRPTCAPLRSRWLTHFGDLSYVLYLFHPLVLGVYFLVVMGGPEKLDSFADVPHVIVAAGLSYGLCLLIHRSLERPLRLFGRELASRAVARS